MGKGSAKVLVLGYSIARPYDDTQVFPTLSITDDHTRHQVRPLAALVRDILRRTPSAPAVTDGRLKAWRSDPEIVGFLSDILHLDLTLSQLTCPKRGAKTHHANNGRLLFFSLVSLLHSWVNGEAPPSVLADMEQRQFPCEEIITPKKKYS